MLYKTVSSPAFLILISFGVLFGAVSVLDEQLDFLLSNYHMNFMPHEISLENEIVILIATFGVMLEHRYWIIEKIHGSAIPEKERQLDSGIQRDGVALILVAVMLELTASTFSGINFWINDASLLKYVEILVLLIFNAIAVLLIFRFLLRMTGFR
ncbi:hypothetical protein [Aestuariispira insulae]|uniref:Uncharacterized protein n=1 Tax=Aestuariispira insulae TaxID=1461337 RepID=A0A3D9HGR2_9PROT|nr:hypothetical protein [Aestuariispira insulae]RED48653.1 hypothetical protein DFP90_107158 [Aestuariispira insulae]